jgi:hypothetical protein
MIPKSGYRFSDKIMLKRRFWAIMLARRFDLRSVAKSNPEHAGDGDDQQDAEADRHDLDAVIA